MGFFAETPGGPGVPGCATPVQDVTRPLATVAVALRGEPKRIDPSPALSSDRFAETRIPIIDTRSWAGCVIPEALVITLGRSRLRNSGPQTPERLEGAFVIPRLRAHLSWGVGGGALQHALVDWLHGTQLTIATERIAIEAVYDVVTPTLSSPTIDPCDLPCFEVTAGASYGSIASTSNPARLTEAVFAEIGTPITIAIPSFATSFTAYVQGSSGDVEIAQVAFGTGLGTLHHFTSPTETTEYRAENAIPLWNGAEFLQIANIAESGDPALVLVVFGLAL